MSRTPAFKPPRNLYVRPRLKPTKGLSLAVTALLALCAATDVFSIVAHVNMYSLLGGVSDGGFAWYTVEDGERADRLVGLASSFYVSALTATAVVFIIWFHRSRKNAEVFVQDIRGRSAGWAIGGWFIPLGQLWIPHGIASASWDASTPTRPDGYRSAVPRTPLTAWWATWILSLVLAGLGSALGRSDNLDTYRQSVGLILAADAADIAAAALAILFVRKLTHMQHTKAAEGPYATV